MNRITISSSDFKVETTSTWLASVLQFALDIDFFAPLQAFKLKMKKVRYSVYQKLTTILASIIMGCESTNDINEVLGPEILAANMLGMEHFPDQSQINTVLNRMDKDSVDQLQNIHHQLFMNYSNTLSSLDDIVVDIDQSGLVANSKTYEFADKGYFPHKRVKLVIKYLLLLLVSILKYWNSTLTPATYTARTAWKIYCLLLLQSLQSILMPVK